MAMAKSVKVNIKWNKQMFKDVEVSLMDGVEVLKLQLFSLTSVPVERQKVMVKGATLKDDTDLESLGLKTGQTLMLMGTAEEVVKPPEEKVVFVEDLAPEEMQGFIMAGLPPGLTNLGNTCYMNSTLQCLNRVAPLVEAMKQVSGGRSEYDNNQNLALATRDLFQSLSSSRQPVMPLQFLTIMRAAFPQFAERGEDGNYAQQDAEECLTSILSALGPKLRGADAAKNAVELLFGIEMQTTLKCVEDETETTMEVERLLKLPCHIEASTSLLIEGLRESLSGTVEKRSQHLGRDSHFIKSSVISRLPPFLFVQEVRFHWRADTRKRAKILKPVKFSLVLDVSELCSDALKASLVPNREKVRLAEEARTQKRKGGPDPPAEDQIMEEAPDAPPAAEEGGGAPVDASDVTANSLKGTGRYELVGVVTHQGRYADGGHYMAWCKVDTDNWLRYDDDKVSQVNDDEILKLTGGGDWHMAYILLYRHLLCE
mmetsp:Transcript_13520/g.31109  ORF Transcript_13520/g.31109 Transcript_13520/m.31109 type:complete len:485 (+) Transcript_13520:47-1501(+)